MRPYWAVIKDSFREAIATRVLWIVVVLITVLLLFLAPLGYGTEQAVELQFRDFRDPRQFVQHLVKGADDVQTPAGHVWQLLSPNLQKEIRALTPETGVRERRAAFDRVRTELNGAFQREHFFDADVWKSVRLNDEAKKLQETGIPKLAQNQRARFNRLAFDAAFHQYIVAAPSETISIHYLTWDWEAPFTVEQLKDNVRMVVLLIISFVVGTFGVLTAIIVTAWIVPRMFDAGAIDLLLSKPVSRSFLFLSKFFGGCAFILCSASYLIAGLYLIVGLRFDVWITGLLWTIPVFVFVFAIFYSVSSLAGVIWRNAIVSIIVAILFWAACKTVGTTYGIVDAYLNEWRAAAIVPAGKTLLITRENGSGFRWNTESQSWSSIFVEDGPPMAALGQEYPYSGPYFDSTNNRIAAMRIPQRRRWMRGAGKLAIASEKNDWDLKESLNAPVGTNQLIVTKKGELLAIGISGIYRLEGDASNSGPEINVFGLKVPIGGDSGFERIDDATTTAWMEPFDAALSADEEKFAVVAGDKIEVFTKNADAKWQVKHREKRENTEAALVGFPRSHVVVANGNGKIDILDPASLDRVAQYRPFRTNQPKSIWVSRNGRWAAVLFHHRKLWLFDDKTQKPVSASISGQGDISAVVFDAQNKLFVGDQFGRVVQYDCENSFAELKRFSPEMDWGETIYTWGLSPLYTVFPKPADMDNVVTYLIMGKATFSVNESPFSVDNSATDDLNSQRLVIDIWQPIWSNLAFLVVMLGITCMIVSFKDF